MESVSLTKWKMYKTWKHQPQLVFIAFDVDFDDIWAKEENEDITRIKQKGKKKQREKWGRKKEKEKLKRLQGKTRKC